PVAPVPKPRASSVPEARPRQVKAPVHPPSVQVAPAVAAWVQNQAQMPPDPVPYRTPSPHPVPYRALSPVQSTHSSQSPPSTNSSHRDQVMETMFKMNENLCAALGNMSSRPTQPQHSSYRKLPDLTILAG